MTQITRINSQHEFFNLSTAVKKLTDKMLPPVGVSYFSFKRTYQDFSKIYLFNNPFILEHYFSRQYCSIGATEAPISLYSSRYDLWEYMPHQKTIYADLENIFDTTHGLTITRKNEQFCDFFVFGTSKENIGIKKFYMNDIKVFDQFCDNFLQAAEDIIIDAYSSKVNLPYHFADNNTSLINSHTQPQIKKYPSLHGCLTKREYDCAHYLIQGKSSKETARALGISHRTIEEHICNMRTKFGLRNKAELIAMLCRNGLNSYKFSKNP